jgi:hypothetical protein
MQKVSTIPNWAKWLAGLALMATALTAAGLSLAMNLSAGLAVGVAVAIAFGLSDIAKILMPVVANGIGWTKHTRSVYAVASIVSVVCACLYLADQFGEVIAAKTAAAAVTASTEQHIDDMRASLTSVRDMATEESQRGGCGPKCQALNYRAENLEIALSDAVRQRQAAKPAEATDGKAVVIAGMIGTGEAETSRATAILLILSALIISELCAHLAGPAAAMIGAARQRPQTPAPAPHTEIPAAVKTARPAGKAKTDRAYWLARLHRDHPALAAQVESGNCSVYSACLQSGLRKPARKSAKWTKVETYMRQGVDA